MNNEMKNYKALIQYDGSRYQGWQSQKRTENTIQGKLMQVLSQYAGHLVEIQGSGRTDAGVHARGQVASFQLKTEADAREIMNYVNHYLPQDIGILELTEAPQRFHARLNAEKKTYVYRIWNSLLPNVFERKWMTVLKEPLDIVPMQEAAEYLLGTHDFAALCAVKQKKKSTVRTIYELDCQRIDQEVRITVTGNGFLHHMVRIMAGTLVECGLGERSPKELPNLLETRKRECAGITMPAKGLILWQVDYPNGIK